MNVQVESQQWPADRKVRWRWAVVAFACGVAAYGSAYLLSAAPQVADGVYARFIGPLLVRPIAQITGVFPFAVSEPLLLAYALWSAGVALVAMRAVIARRRRARNALAGGARRAMRDAGIVVTLFYLMWGVGYAQSTFEARVGWPAWEGATEPELVTLAEQATIATNQAYVALHGVEDAGAPTPVPSNGKALDTALDQGWARAAQVFGLPTTATRRHGRVKRPFTSGLIARFGIVGVYFPFTAEANVVRGLPAVALPHTMAHEKAHQRGIASEAEASFMAFVASAAADDPLSRYAAAFYAQNEIARNVSGEERQRLAAMRLPGVQRDLRDLAEWYNRYRGVATQVGRAVNDRYLRANRVPGGVRNYGLSVRLLVIYARLHGGELLWPVVETAQAPIPATQVPTTHD